jgi:hypothetical protein
MQSPIGINWTVAILMLSFYFSLFSNNMNTRNEWVLAPNNVQSDKHVSITLHAETLLVLLTNHIKGNRLV